MACQQKDALLGVWIIDTEKMRSVIHTSLVKADGNVTVEGLASMSDQFRAVEEAMLSTVSGTVLLVEKSSITLSLGANRIECRRLGQQTELITVACGKVTQELKFDGTSLTWALESESTQEQQFPYVFKRSSGQADNRATSRF